MLHTALSVCKSVENNTEKFLASWEKCIRNTERAEDRAGLLKRAGRHYPREVCAPALTHPAGSPSVYLGFIPSSPCQDSTPMVHIQVSFQWILPVSRQMTFVLKIKKQNKTKTSLKLLSSHSNLYISFLTSFPA